MNPAFSARSSLRFVLFALVAAVALHLAAPNAVAQDSGLPDFTVDLHPRIVVPIGEYDGGELRTGAGGAGSIFVSLGDSPVLLGARLGIVFHQPQIGDQSVLMGSFLGGVGLYMSRRPNLAIVAEVDAGLRTGFVAGGDPITGAGLLAEVGVATGLGESFRVGARAGYERWFGQYRGFALSLSGSLLIRGYSSSGPADWNQPAPEPRPSTDSASTGSDSSEPPGGPEAAWAGDDTVSVVRVELDRVFPAFHKYYHENPIGQLELVNTGSESVLNIEVGFLIPRYMDAVSIASGPARLDPGERVTVPVPALLANNIMDVTTSTVTTAQFTVRYELGGSIQEFSLDDSVDIANRNAMTWDDNRKAAAFVTPNDPALQVVARGAAAIVRSSGFELVNQPFRNAAGVYEALRELGLEYVVDPNTPFVEFSQNTAAIDYLQFPGQTIQVGGGDCDDLSICFGAAMHAIGFEAAFVTVPGHVFPAVNLGISAGQATREFSRVDDLIISDGEVWLPVELTNFEAGFLEAWAHGARQWREAKARDQAEVYPIADAWEHYSPTGLRDDYYRPRPIDSDAVLEAYQSEVTRFIDLQILPRVSDLQDQIARSDNSPALINRLGVLYARYGLSERARVQFELVLEQDAENLAALVNLGNLAIYESDYQTALEYFEEARRADPNDAAVLLGIARANHALENYGTASEAYDLLRSVDPALAGRFVYLDYRDRDTARAAAQAQRFDLVWKE